MTTKAYILVGNLAETENKTDKNGNAYLSGKLTAKIGGEQKTVRAMAFGKAVAGVESIWADGQTRLYGVIEKASETTRGGVFRVIAPGRERKAD
jgi:hypothetical protein